MNTRYYYNYDINLPIMYVLRGFFPKNIIQKIRNIKNMLSNPSKTPLTRKVQTPLTRNPIYGSRRGSRALSSDNNLPEKTEGGLDIMQAFFGMLKQKIMIQASISAGNPQCIQVLPTPLEFFIITAAIPSVIYAKAHLLPPVPPRITSKTHIFPKFFTVTNTENQSSPFIVHACQLC